MAKRTNRVAWGLALVTSSVLVTAPSARAEPAAIPQGTRNVLHGHKAGVWSLTWSPNGQQIASVDETGRTLRLWNALRGQPDKTVTDSTGQFLSVHWSPRGLLAVVQRGTEVLLRNEAAESVVARLAGCRCFYFTWDRAAHRLSGWAATGSGRGGVWDLATGKLLQRPDRVPGAALSPDGMSLALINDTGDVRVAEATTGRELRVLQSHPGWDFGHSSRPIAWSPDGKRVAAGTFRTPEPDDVVRVWRADTGQELFTHPAKGRTDEGDVVAITWSPDGRYLAYSRSGHTEAYLWDPASGQVQVLTAEDLPLSLAFSPDGNHLAAGCLDGSIALWTVHPPPAGPKASTW